MGFDLLKMYFMKPFDVGNGIIIDQPTIGNIIDFGEQDFYDMVYVFCSNPTTYRVVLWDMGIDWCKTSDFQLFCLIYKSIDPDAAKIMFRDVNFQGFELAKRIETIHGEDGSESTKQSMCLYNRDQDIEIDEDSYVVMSQYIRTMFDIFPKVQNNVRGRTTKEWIIDEDRMNLQAKKNQKWSSSLLPLISSCLNHPGFKYKRKELEDVGIYEFMDSVQRLQVYEKTTALLRGCYSGFVDVSNIDKKEFNFMRELDTNGEQHKFDNSGKPTVK